MSQRRSSQQADLTGITNLNQATLQNLQIRSFDQIRNGSSYLVAVLPQGYRYRDDARLQDYARDNPNNVAFLFVNEDGSSRRLGADELEVALRCLREGATDFSDKLAEVRAEVLFQAEFQSFKDRVNNLFDDPRFRFNSSQTAFLYELNGRDLLLIARRRDVDFGTEEFTSFLQQALLNKYPDLSFEQVSETFEKLYEFNHNLLFQTYRHNAFSASFSDALKSYNEVVSSGNQLLADLMSMTFERTLGIPSFVLLNWQRSGRLSGEDMDVRELLSDPGIPTFVGGDREDRQRRITSLLDQSRQIRETSWGWPTDREEAELKEGTMSVAFRNIISLLERRQSFDEIELREIRGDFSALENGGGRLSGNPLLFIAIREYFRITGEELGLQAFSSRRINL